MTIICPELPRWGWVQHCADTTLCGMMMYSVLFWVKYPISQQEINGQACYLLSINLYYLQWWCIDKTFQHSGIVVIIHNICSNMSIQCDRVDKDFYPCWSVRCDKPSPVIEHILFLLTKLRAWQIPWWSFQHEFYLKILSSLYSSQVGFLM